MGVDVRIYLPSDVRIHDVANVLGILAGLKPVWYVFERSSYYDGPPSGYVEVPGVKANVAHDPSCAEILIGNGTPLVDGDMAHSVLYFFENERGLKHICPPSSAFWIACGQRLIRFFGGSIDFKDCDDKGRDRHCPKPRKRNDPQDGKPWHDFQQAMLHLRPLTMKDLIRADKYAAYKMSGERG